MLSNLSFLHCKCSLGLVTSLNTDFNEDLTGKHSYTAVKKWTETKSSVEVFAKFVYKNTHLLLR